MFNCLYNIGTKSHVFAFLIFSFRFAFYNIILSQEYLYLPNNLVRLNLLFNAIYNYLFLSHILSINTNYTGIFEMWLIILWRTYYVLVSTIFLYFVLMCILHICWNAYWILLTLEPSCSKKYIFDIYMYTYTHI